MLHGENLKPSQLLSPALSYYAGERGAGCFAPVLTSVRSLAGRPRGARRRRVAHATGAYRVARRPNAPLARKPSAEVYRRRENGSRAAGDAKGSENDVY